jgi:hypothetical protein
MAATRVSTLRPGRDPPTRPASRTVWLISASKPRRTIKVAGTMRPALATRLGSSKTASIRSMPRDTGLTENASSIWAERPAC